MLIKWVSSPSISRDSKLQRGPRSLSLSLSAEQSRCTQSEKALVTPKELDYMEGVIGVCGGSLVCLECLITGPRRNEDLCARSRSGEKKARAPREYRRPGTFKNHGGISDAYLY